MLYNVCFPREKIRTLKLQSWSYIAEYLHTDTHAQFIYMRTQIHMCLCAQWNECTLYESHINILRVHMLVLK